jgi:hypothetical protein
MMPDAFQLFSPRVDRECPHIERAAGQRVTSLLYHADPDTYRAGLLCRACPTNTSAFVLQSLKTTVSSCASKGRLAAARTGRLPIVSLGVRHGH